MACSTATFFQGKEIRPKDIKDQEYNLTFKVTEVPATAAYLQHLSPHEINTGFVVGYNTDALDDFWHKPKRHFVYLRGYDAINNLLVGHNSWGDSHTPKVFVQNVPARRIVLSKVMVEVFERHEENTGEKSY